MCILQTGTEKLPKISVFWENVYIFQCAQGFILVNLVFLESTMCILSETCGSTKKITQTCFQGVNPGVV